MPKRSRATAKTKAPKKTGAAVLRPKIPDEVSTRLWVAAGGRCQFNGCNKPLWRNNRTMEQLNLAYRAHIYAFAPGGTRYDKVLSPKLKTEFRNLMLVCGTCHRTFDSKRFEKRYTPDVLIEMKRAHEARIEFVTGIAPEKRSDVVLYGAKIGEHDSPLNFDTAAEAMFPARYPAMDKGIELSLASKAFKDKDAEYWKIEDSHLVSLFAQNVKARKSNGAGHFSVFALAPIPLLIRLGSLLGEITEATTYQLHRYPTTWKWLEETGAVRHVLQKGKPGGDTVALKLELSASIADDRVRAVLGDACSIWSITHPVPGNDYLRRLSDLEDLKATMREALRGILLSDPTAKGIHVFPAMPVSAAVELGRVWMPKADHSLILYDEYGGFHHALTIERE